jgi:hypothetical protein
LDPDSHKFLDDKPKCMECVRIWERFWFFIWTYDPDPHKSER